MKAFIKNTCPDLIHNIYMNLEVSFNIYVLLHKLNNLIINHNKGDDHRIVSKNLLSSLHFGHINVQERHLDPIHQFHH